MPSVREMSSTVHHSRFLEGKVYVIRWKDSGTHHADGWQTAEEISERAHIEEVTTVGFCFLNTDTSLYLGQTWDSEERHFFGTQVILKSNIVAWEMLDPVVLHD